MTALVNLAPLADSVDIHDAVVSKMQFPDKAPSPQIISPDFDRYRYQLIIRMFAVLIVGMIVVSRMHNIGFIVMGVIRITTNFQDFLHPITRDNQLSIAAHCMRWHNVYRQNCDHNCH